MTPRVPDRGRGSSPWSWGYSGSGFPALWSKGNQCVRTDPGEGRDKGHGSHPQLLKRSKEILPAPLS